MSLGQMFLVSRGGKSFLLVNTAISNPFGFKCGLHSGRCAVMGRERIYSINMNFNLVDTFCLNLSLV